MDILDWVHGGGRMKQTAPHMKTSGHKQTISREEILSRLQDPAFALVNVMPKETFETGHIPHSINLPLVEIEATARQVFPVLTREIAIYCMGPT
jgi:rhodanese-related sulfurtransferase